MSMAAQDFKLKLKTLERRRLDYDADRRAFARLEAKRSKTLHSGGQVKPEVTTQLQSKEHTMAGMAPVLLRALVPLQTPNKDMLHRLTLVTVQWLAGSCGHAFSMIFTAHFFVHLRSRGVEVVRSSRLK